MHATVNAGMKNMIMNDAVNVPQRMMGTRLTDIPGRTHGEERRDEVDRTDGGRHRREDQAQREEVDVESGENACARHRHIGEPSAIRRLPDEEARVEEDPREEKDPVAQTALTRGNAMSRAPIMSGHR